MLGALARSLFGTANDRIVRGFDKPVAKINALDEVKTAQVDVVWDPPWDMSKMSEAARVQLNLM